jgi:hypothetical protein
MVIEDDELTTGFAELIGLGPGVGSTVHSHNEVRHGLPQAASDTCRTEAVPLRRAIRNEALDLSPREAQVSAEDRERGDAIDIVVAIQGDPFLGVDSFQQARRGLGNTGNLFGRAARRGSRKREATSGVVNPREESRAATTSGMPSSTASRRVRTTSCAIGRIQRRCMREKLSPEPPTGNFGF